MTKMEKQARKITRDAYYEFLEGLHSPNSDKSLNEYLFNVYYQYMKFLKELFPETTNEDRLRETWRMMFIKKRRHL